MAKTERIALVTGTSSGIGAAVVEILLDDGWQVIGMSRKRADFDNPNYRHIEIDLGNLQRLKDIAESDLAKVLGEDRWERVGLVNNAADIGTLRPMQEADPLRLAQTFAINVAAPMYLMGFVVRAVPAASMLRIVNISTGAAVQPLPGGSDYSASKSALRMAGMVLATELQSDERPGGARRNAAILSYAPGVVDTPMQVTARAPDRPWNRMFVNFHEQGQLQPPRAPAIEIVSFLDSDRCEPFAERRLGDA